MSTTITAKEATTSSKTTTTTTTTPLTYTNLSNYINNNSSSDSLDSNASTIKITSSPSPQPTIIPSTTTTNQPKKINIPNYYVAPKVSIINNSIPSTDATSPTDYTPLPPSLVRKKSGELVKSSLKLPSLLQRSLSTPQFTHKPAPSTPRKSVRFASRLINVKMFDGCDSPMTVSSTNSPCHSPPSFDFEPDFLDEDDVYTFIRKPKTNSTGFDWNWDKSSSSSSDDEEDEDAYWSTPKQFNSYRKFTTSSSTSTITTTMSKEYRLTSHNIPKLFNTKDSIVWLPSAYVLKTDSGKTFLFGLVNVKNLSFEKNIFIKLTLNNWKTSIVFGGQSIISFVKSVDSNTDQFKFKIALDDLVYDSTKVDLQLCIKYEVGGQEYWDNNFGNNYKFKLTRMDNKKQQPQSQPQQQAKKVVKKEDEFPQFNELVSKLILHQQQDNKKATGQRTFSVFNNFEDKQPFTRPLLNKSFSSSDISHQQQQQQRQRYSQRQQQRNTSSSAKKEGRLDFSSLSYADLLNNYCFANNSTTNSTASSTASTSPINSSTSISSTSCSTPVLTSMSCSPPSTASTLHSFSDSIHI
ncbi:GAC1 Serine/threonine-protein phosphatase 1 regulatory subunit GAC1 [Candida maltosa Xu316]